MNTKLQKITQYIHSKNHKKVRELSGKSYMTMEELCKELGRDIKIKK